MAATLPNNIFFGIPPAPERNTIVNFLKQRSFKHVIIPCAGRFAMAEAVVEAGIPAKEIVCGDISLFSSLVGFYLSDQDFSTLSIRTEYDFVDPGADRTEYLASLLYAMMLNKASESSYYAAEFKRALELEQEKHIKTLQDNLEQLYSRLGGMQYHITDLRNLVDRYKDDKDTFIFVDPPALGTKDYPKMFDYKGMITWEEPAIAQFGSEDDMISLFKSLEDAKATAIILKFKSKLGATARWHTYHVSVDTKMNMKFLFLNRLIKESYIDRPRIYETKPLKIPIIGKDHTITRDSRVMVMPVDRDIAWYYRDLFTHKFGAGSADNNYLILIDGKITTVRGYGPLGLSGNGMLHEIYGIVYNNTKYRHLGRLIMRLVTSQDFASAVNTTLFPLIGITTTTYKNYREDRELKRLGFEVYESKDAKEGAGKYKIKNRAPFADKSFREMIAEWLTEEENYGKQQRARPRKQRTSNRPGNQTRG